MFSFCCVDVVDNLLYKANIVSSDLSFKFIKVIQVKVLCSHGVVDRKYWESYLFRPRTPVFIWRVVSRTCMNLHENLMQATCASFLHKFLDCVSPPLGRPVSHQVTRKFTHHCIEVCTNRIRIEKKSCSWTNHRQQGVGRCPNTHHIPSPTPGKSWIFVLENSRTSKVLENQLGPRKFWKNSLKVTYFSSCSNGKKWWTDSSQSAAPGTEKLLNCFYNHCMYTETICK